MKRSFLFSFAVLTISLLLPLRPAWAVVMTGTFQGLFFGILSLPDFSYRGIGKEGATFSFTYDTALAPAPIDPQCSGDLCSYFSVSGASQWLSASFDFGEFTGSTIPGTASEQNVIVNNVESDFGDRIFVGIVADWNTSFGFMPDEAMPAQFIGPSTMLSSTALPTTSTHATEGFGFSDRQHVGGPGVFGIEYDFNITSLDLSPTPEPATLWLLWSGVIGMVWARRRKTL